MKKNEGCEEETALSQEPTIREGKQEKVKLRYSKQMREFLNYLAILPYPGVPDLLGSVKDFKYFKNILPYPHETIPNLGTWHKGWYSSWSLQRTTKALIRRGDIKVIRRSRAGYLYELTEQGKETIQRLGRRKTE